MNQTIFFTHLMPRVYPHPVPMTLFTFFLKYYGVFLMMFIVWHLTRSISLFEAIDNRITSCEAEIQNLKRKREDTFDFVDELGDVLPKRQRVFRRYPRAAPFKFESSFRQEDEVKADEGKEGKEDVEVKEVKDKEV
jgi:hypothetical protein